MSTFVAPMTMLVSMACAKLETTSLRSTSLRHALPPTGLKALHPRRKPLVLPPAATGIGRHRQLVIGPEQPKSFDWPWNVVWIGIVTTLCFSYDW